MDSGIYNLKDGKAFMAKANKKRTTTFTMQSPYKTKLERKPTHQYRHSRHGFPYMHSNFLISP